MSEFKISCPNCQQHLLCNESYRGVQFPCPSCGRTIAVPPLNAPPPPAGLKIASAAPDPVAPRELQPHIPRKPQVSSRPRGSSWLTTFLFAWFLGWLGMDRFYHGRIGLGIMKLITFGGWGWWTTLDIGFLLKGTYKDSRGNTIQASSRRQKWIAFGSTFVPSCLFFLVLWLVMPEEGITIEFGSKRADLSKGFASPEAVFEAMKTNPPDTFLDLILVLPPEEQYVMAYGGFVATRLAVNFQTDARKKQEAEKDFTALIEKYHLADKLEINAGSSEEQVKAMAAKALADVDLTALLNDLETFVKKYESANFKIGDASNDPKMVSLKDLKIEGDEANGTALYSDDTEKPIVFVKSGGGWFYSQEKTDMKSDGGANGLGGGKDGLVLVVTFDSEASLKRATKERLLQGVAYDRSEPAALEMVGSGRREATLSFRLPASSDKEAIIRKIRRSPGVTRVDNLTSDEMKALLAVKFAEAFDKTSFTDGNRLPTANVRRQEQVHTSKVKGLEDWELIQPGMSQEEVLKLLGAPAIYRSSSKGPMWDYLQTNNAGDVNSGILRIYFGANGNVRGKARVL